MVGALIMCRGYCSIRQAEAVDTAIVEIPKVLIHSGEHTYLAGVLDS
jgi:hypothetical protein